MDNDANLKRSRNMTTLGNVDVIVKAGKLINLDNDGICGISRKVAN